MWNFGLCFVSSVFIIAISCFVRFIISAFNEKNDNHVASYFMIIPVIVLSIFLYIISTDESKDELHNLKISYNDLLDKVENQLEETDDLYDKLSGVDFSVNGMYIDSENILKNFKDTKKELNKAFSKCSKKDVYSDLCDSDIKGFVSFGIMYNVFGEDLRNNIMNVSCFIFGFIITFFTFNLILLQSLLSITVSPKLTKILYNRGVNGRYKDLQKKINDTIFFNVILFIFIFVVGSIMFGGKYVLGSVISFVFSFLNSLSHLKVSESSIYDYVTAYEKYFELDAEHLFYRIL